VSAVATAVALYLTLTAGLALVRLRRGPTLGDRVLAVTLVGTTGVAVLLLLSRATAAPAFVDVALVLAVLAAVPVVVHATRLADRR
jgi:multicomponent Na+:H+ antiporter subunit F